MATHARTSELGNNSHIRQIRIPTTLSRYFGADRFLIYIIRFEPSTMTSLHFIVSTACKFETKHNPSGHTTASKNPNEVLRFRTRAISTSSPRLTSTSNCHNGSQVSNQTKHNDVACIPPQSQLRESFKPSTMSMSTINLTVTMAWEAQVSHSLVGANLGSG